MAKKHRKNKCIKTVFGSNPAEECKRKKTTFVGTPNLHRLAPSAHICLEKQSLNATMMRVNVQSRNEGVSSVYSPSNGAISDKKTNLSVCCRKKRHLRREPGA